MKKPLASIFLLMAPCLALMAMALYLPRRAAVAPSVDDLGPFRVQAVGIETQEITPVNVYEGYDRRFHLIFAAQGARPKGWGAPDKAVSNHGIAKTKFWLERDGKRQLFSPSEAETYTSRWDKDKKRYSNEIRLRTGPIPDDATLKMSGLGQINPRRSPKLGPPIPFTVTLKKAGQKWRAPQVSRDTGVTIQKIEIKKQPNGETEVIASLLLAPGTSKEATWHSVDFVDTNWKQVGLNLATFAKLGQQSSSRVYELNESWKTSALSQSKQRDLIFVERRDFEGKWPLELCFSIKKDGKPIFGVVQPLTRPSGKPPLR